MLFDVKNSIASSLEMSQEAKEYLSHMYGAAQYVIVDDVKKLPLKVADVYPQLTT